jgi:hypothetical protein
MNVIVILSDWLFAGDGKWGSGTERSDCHSGHSEPTYYQSVENRKPPGARRLQCRTGRAPLPTVYRPAAPVSPPARRIALSVDEIDDADKTDEPRTKARRRRVRVEWRTPPDEPVPEGDPFTSGGGSSMSSISSESSTSHFEKK